MTTDTFTSQEATMLEHSEYLLRLLAHEQDAGLASTAVGRHCVYCEWSRESYLTKPQHEGECPIRQARKFLRRAPPTAGGE